MFVLSSPLSSFRYPCFCIIYWTPNCEEAHVIFLPEKRRWAAMYRHPHSSRCRKRRRARKHVRPDTFAGMIVASRFREGSWDTQQQSVAQKTNQTKPAACHVRHGLPTPCVHVAFKCFHAAIRRLQNMLRKPAFSPLSVVVTGLWGSVSMFFFFLSMINKKKNKKKLFSLRLQCIAWWMFLFRLREGECSDWVCWRNRTQLRYDWV